MAHQKISSHVTTWTQDLKFMGMELGTRMSVIDLDGSGTLFVHSPIRLTKEIRSQLDSLGKVAYVAAPNKWHHLFIKDKTQFRDSMAKISEWDFDRIIVAHGSIVDTDGKAKFTAAYL